MKKNIFYPYETYIVRYGDTLNKIAKKYKIPLNLLISTNPQIIKNKYITIGQIISIPNQITIPNHAISIPRQVITIIAPDQLEIIEKNVSEIIGDINNQDWNEANRKLTIIKSNLDELRPILEKDSIPLNLIYNINNAIANLDNAVTSESSYDAKVNANTISLYISYILDYYKTKLSTNIIRLKYIARSIIYNAEVENWNIVNDNFDFLNVVWNDLNPELSSAYSESINEFIQTIDSLGQSIANQDSVTTINNAIDILNQINLFEQSYISV